MPTRLPSARNRSASQMTMGVLPVPPTVRLPTLMTGVFSRRCFRTPRAYIHTRSRTTTPYTTDKGHNSSRTTGGIFIARRHPIALPPRAPLDRERHGCFLQVAAPPLPFFSSFPDSSAGESIPRQRLPGYSPESLHRLRQSAPQSPQNSPSKDRTREPCRTPPTPEYCVRQNARGSLPQTRHLRRDRQRRVRRCYPATTPLYRPGFRHRSLWPQHQGRRWAVPSVE